MDTHRPSTSTTRWPTARHWLIAWVMLVFSFSAWLWTFSTETAGSPVVRPTAGPVQPRSFVEHASRSRIVAGVGRDVSSRPHRQPVRSPAASTNLKVLRPDGPHQRGFLLSVAWAKRPDVRRLRMCENGGSYPSKPTD